MKFTKEAEDKGQEVYQQLVEKAWESATFKEQLIANPAQTIAEFTGSSSELLKNTNFVVEDQSDADTIFINIPINPNSEAMELSDEQLDQVSGGELAVLGTIAAVATLAYIAWDVSGGMVDGVNDAIDDYNANNPSE
jgi:hypothetical protein